MWILNEEHWLKMQIYYGLCGASQQEGCGFSALGPAFLCGVLCVFALFVAVSSVHSAKTH